VPWAANTAKERAALNSAREKRRKSAKKRRSDVATGIQ
jgi:hypothetical protein